MSLVSGPRRQTTKRDRQREVRCRRVKNRVMEDEGFLHEQGSRESDGSWDEVTPITRQQDAYHVKAHEHNMKRWTTNNRKSVVEACESRTS